MSGVVETGQVMDGFVARCRAAGLVLTPQRLAVFRHLAAVRGHPSADELYTALRRELPTLSLATVYKALEALARIGALRRMSRAGARGAGMSGWNPTITSCASNVGVCVTYTTSGSTR